MATREESRVKQRLIAVLLVLAAMSLPLTAGMAGSTPETLATGDGKPWLAYLPMEGVQAWLIPGIQAEAPPGLDALYGWMGEERDGSEVLDARLFRMPNGRVLISCSRSEVAVDISPVDLIRLWPEIAAKLMKKSQYVDGNTDNASIQTLAGEEWLHIHTKAVLDGEKMLSVELECFALCREGAIVEIWQAWPSTATYKYDDGAAAELQADLGTAAEWIHGVSLPE